MRTDKRVEIAVAIDVAQDGAGVEGDTGQAGGIGDGNAENGVNLRQVVVGDGDAYDIDCQATDAVPDQPHMRTFADGIVDGGDDDRLRHVPVARGEREARRIR